ncbi:MAG: hypothetical protein ABFD79_04095 [Phycisphaerales bacterium]
MNVEEKSKIVALFRILWHWMPLFILVVIPYCIIKFPICDVWKRRLVAIAIDMPLLMLWFFIYGLNPASTFMIEFGKLSKPKYAKIKLKLIFLMRVLFCIFALFIAYNDVFLFYSDILSLDQNDSIERFSCVIKISRPPFPGLSFLYQSFIIDINNNEKDYSMWFPFRSRLNPGDRYIFIALPKSSMVLDVKELE